MKYSHFGILYEENDEQIGTIPTLFHIYRVNDNWVVQSMSPYNENYTVTKTFIMKTNVQWLDMRRTCNLTLKNYAKKTHVCQDWCNLVIEQLKQKNFEINQTPTINVYIVNFTSPDIESMKLDVSSSIM
jgi:hypothetical protein